NAAEAHRMPAAARQHPELVTQIVPSDWALKGQDLVADLIRSGYLGELREVYLYCLHGNLADPAAPLHWRQDAARSGFNMLAVATLHEPLLRWPPPPVRVLAQAPAFTPTRIAPASGVRRPVGTPDSVQVLAQLANSARAVYQLSGVVSFGQG